MKKAYLYRVIIVCLLIILLCAFLYVRKQIDGFQTAPSLDLVVARYNEDVSWIKHIPEDIYSKIYIYNKGPDTEFDLPKSNVIKLENLGRECHSYLTHVVTNYDNLADVTFFMQGSAGHRDDKKHQTWKIIEYLKDNKTSAIICNNNKEHIMVERAFLLNDYEITHAENKKLNSETKLTPSEDRPLGNWFDKRFPGESISGISYASILAVSREDIQKRPVEFYDKLLAELNHVNPEVGHYFERVWANVFSIDTKNFI